MDMQSHGGETWKPRLSQKQMTVPQSYGFKAFLKEEVVIPSVAHNKLNEQNLKYKNKL